MDLPKWHTSMRTLLSRSLPIRQKMWWWNISRPCVEWFARKEVWWGRFVRNPIWAPRKRRTYDHYLLPPNAEWIELESIIERFDCLFCLIFLKHKLRNWVQGQAAKIVRDHYQDCEYKDEYEIGCQCFTEAKGTLLTRSRRVPWAYERLGLAWFKTDPRDNPMVFAKRKIGFGLCDLASTERTHVSCISRTEQTVGNSWYNNSLVKSGEWWQIRSRRRLATERGWFVVVWINPAFQILILRCWNFVGDTTYECWVFGLHSNDRGHRHL